MKNNFKSSPGQKSDLDRRNRVSVAKKQGSRPSLILYDVVRDTDKVLGIANTKNSKSVKPMPLSKKGKYVCKVRSGISVKELCVPRDEAAGVGHEVTVKGSESSQKARPCQSKLNRKYGALVKRKNLRSTAESEAEVTSTPVASCSDESRCESGEYVKSCKKIKLFHEWQDISQQTCGEGCGHRVDSGTGDFHGFMLNIYGFSGAGLEISLIQECGTESLRPDEFCGGFATNDKNKAYFPVSEDVFANSESKVDQDALLQKDPLLQLNGTCSRVLGGAEVEYFGAHRRGEATMAVVNSQDFTSSIAQESLDAGLLDSKLHSGHNDSILDVAFHNFDHGGNVYMCKHTDLRTSPGRQCQNLDFGTVEQSKFLSRCSSSSTRRFCSGCKSNLLQGSVARSEVLPKETVLNKKVVLKIPSLTHTCEKTSLSLEQLHSSVECEGVYIDSPTGTSKCLESSQLRPEETLEKVKSSNSGDLKQQFVGRCRVTRSSRKAAGTTLSQNTELHHIASDTSVACLMTEDKKVMQSAQLTPSEMNSVVQIYRADKCTVMQGDNSVKSEVVRNTAVTVNRAVTVNSKTSIVMGKNDKLPNDRGKSDKLHKDNVNSLDVNVPSDTVSNGTIRQGKKRKYSSTSDIEEHESSVTKESSVNRSHKELHNKISAIKLKKPTSVNCSEKRKDVHSVRGSTSQTKLNRDGNKNECVGSPLNNSQLDIAVAATINSPKVKVVTEKTSPVKIDVQNNSIHSFSSTMLISNKNKVDAPTVAPKYMKKGNSGAAKGKHSHSEAIRRSKVSSSFRDELFKPDKPQKVVSERSSSFECTSPVPNSVSSVSSNAETDVSAKSVNLNPKHTHFVQPNSISPEKGRSGENNLVSVLTDVQKDHPAGESSSLENKHELTSVVKHCSNKNNHDALSDAVQGEFKVDSADVDRNKRMNIKLRSSRQHRPPAVRGYTLNDRCNTLQMQEESFSSGRDNQELFSGRMNFATAIGLAPVDNQHAHGNSNTSDLSCKGLGNHVENSRLGLGNHFADHEFSDNTVARKYELDDLVTVQVTNSVQKNDGAIDSGDSKDSSSSFSCNSTAVSPTVLGTSSRHDLPSPELLPTVTSKLCSSAFKKPAMLISQRSLPSGKNVKHVTQIPALQRHRTQALESHCKSLSSVNSLESIRPMLEKPRAQVVESSAVKETVEPLFCVPSSLPLTSRVQNGPLWMSSSRQHDQRLCDDIDDDAISLFASSEIFGTEFGGSQECKVTWRGNVKPTFLKDSDDESEEEVEKEVETKQQGCLFNKSSHMKSKNDTAGPSKWPADVLEFSVSDRFWDDDVSPTYEGPTQQNEMPHASVAIAAKERAQEVETKQGTVNPKSQSESTSGISGNDCQVPKSHSGSTTGTRAQVWQSSKRQLASTGISVQGRQGPKIHPNSSTGATAQGSWGRTSQSGSSPGIPSQVRQNPKTQPRSSPVNPPQVWQDLKTQTRSNLEISVAGMQATNSQGIGVAGVKRFQRKYCRDFMRRGRCDRKICSDLHMVPEFSIFDMKEIEDRLVEANKMSYNYAFNEVLGRYLVGIDKEAKAKNEKHQYSWLYQSWEWILKTLQDCGMSCSGALNEMIRVVCNKKDYLISNLSKRCIFELAAFHEVIFETWIRVKLITNDYVGMGCSLWILENHITACISRSPPNVDFCKTVIKLFELLKSQNNSYVKVKLELVQKFCAILESVGLALSPDLTNGLQVKSPVSRTSESSVDNSGNCVTSLRKIVHPRIISPENKVLACESIVQPTYSSSINKSPATKLPILEKGTNMTIGDEWTKLPVVKAEPMSVVEDEMKSPDGDTLRYCVGDLRNVVEARRRKRMQLAVENSTLDVHFSSSSPSDGGLSAGGSNMANSSLATGVNVMSNVPVPPSECGVEMATPCHITKQAANTPSFRPKLNRRSWLLPGENSGSGFCGDNTTISPFGTPRRQNLQRQLQPSCQKKSPLLQQAPPPKQMTPPRQVTPPQQPLPSELPALLRQPSQSRQQASLLQPPQKSASLRQLPPSQQPVSLRRPPPPRQRASLQQPFLPRESTPLQQSPSSQQPSPQPQASSRPQPQVSSNPQPPASSHPQPKASVPGNISRHPPECAQPTGQLARQSSYALQIEQKLRSDLDMIRECLGRGDFITVARILEVRKATLQSSEIARHAYQVLKDEMNNVTTHFLNIVRAAVGRCDDKKMLECLTVIGVSLMLHLVGRGQWRDAMTILNIMYEFRIDPHAIMVENEGELCSPARCTLGCCEVFMNNGYCVRAANIMKDFRLLEPNPNLWLLKYNAGDDKIRNVMCKHVFLGMVDEDISVALKFFRDVYMCQKNCGDPIDLKSGFNDLLVGLLNARRESEALTVYRQFLSAVGRVEDTTLRALLAVAVDSEDIQYAGTIWSCLRLRGTYFQPVGQANSFVQVKSFWLKEEMYMTLLNHLNQLAAKFTLETIYFADADQFTVHLFLQDENVTYDSSTPAMLKTNTLRKFAVDRVKNVLRYNFQPPLHFLPNPTNHNTHVALMLNPEDVRQYLISAMQY